jgi:hypothetical protein
LQIRRRRHHVFLVIKQEQGRSNASLKERKHAMTPPLKQSFCLFLDQKMVELRYSHLKKCNPRMGALKSCVCSFFAAQHIFGSSNTGQRR